MATHVYPPSHPQTSPPTVRTTTISKRILLQHREMEVGGVGTRNESIKAPRKATKEGVRCLYEDNT